ncbi:MAG: phosphatidylserine decarboxylase [Desulfomonile tiedjei]|nr:phosphatidylserine decarboxylase [Desulfomonile tiedjei]
MRVIAISMLCVGAGLFLLWRYVWFFRNPHRVIPAHNALVSPADGTVVYVKSAEPHETVFSVKQDVPLTIPDILKEDLSDRRLVIGVFMSPFNVHYNRVPLSGTVDFIRHHPSKSGNRYMSRMHLRSVLGMPPYYQGSEHIVENERTVTRITGTFKDEECSYYVVQIAAHSVNGIDSYVDEGERVSTGQVFGMIRIGSQVDLVLPHGSTMNVKVREGDRVYAGESVLVE